MPINNRLNSVMIFFYTFKIDVTAGSVNIEVLIDFFTIRIGISTQDLANFFA